MAKLDLTKYGITGATVIAHNPSYEQLFEEETKAGIAVTAVGMPKLMQCPRCVQVTNTYWKSLPFMSPLSHVPITGKRLHVPSCWCANDSISWHHHR